MQMSLSGTLSGLHTEGDQNALVDKIRREHAEMHSLFSKQLVANQIQLQEEA